MPAWIRGMIWISGRDIARSTIETMQKDGYIDAWRKVHPDLEQEPGYTFPVWNPQTRLDYVFTPSAFASRFTACDVRSAPPRVKAAAGPFPVLVGVLRL